MAILVDACVLLPPLLLLHLLLFVPCLCLDLDGALLLSLKYSVLSDPSSALDSWNYNDVNPCLWTGVKCAEVGGAWRVVGLSLPNMGIVGSLPEDMGFIPHLKSLDLSGNLINGPLPMSLLNSSEIEAISMGNNAIDGEIPELLPKGLKVLNLSNNELTGKIPASLASLENISVVSLRNNHLSGVIPGGFLKIEFLDLSSNSLNGALPSRFIGENLKYMNLSHNKISGVVSQEFAARMPASAAVDLSYNFLSGRIPESGSISGQNPEAFAGNVDLCGLPLKKLCTVPSEHSLPPNISANFSSPAIAAIPRSIDATNLPENPSTRAVNAPTTLQRGMKPATVAGIAVAPLAGIALLAMAFLYVHQRNQKDSKYSNPPPATTDFHEVSLKETRNLSLTPWPCLKTREEYDTSETAYSDDNEPPKQNQYRNPTKLQRSLIMVDGETKLEIETLLRATAYVIGSNGDTIVYKAVLADGTAFAVRRIGEIQVPEMKTFQRHLESLAKLRHENLVRVRGFYWGDDEKLLLHDYISNCNLANISYRMMTGASPHQLNFQNRVKIAKGIARGLKFIHSNKYVHGNIKPSNILLTDNMEPLISDLGIDRLVYGENRRKPHCSACHSSSRASTSLCGDESQSIELHGSAECPSPYHAPESLKNQRPNPKWDVYSFGILLLELLNGKVLSRGEIRDWGGAAADGDGDWALSMADAVVRGDAAGREEEIVNWCKLGFRCASSAPHKRPTMKEALRILEKM